uniref:Tensin 3 n=1 Tax=Rodentolepis nana TaxID=102285 RepID=A0A0R3T9U7_RODNA
LLPNAGGVISAAGSNRNTETTLVWAKSQSNPSSTLLGSVRSGIQNEGSTSESAGDRESSPSSMKSRSRKLSSIDRKDARHDGGVYADFAISRFSSYPYGQDGSATQITKHEFPYDSRTLNTASTYQSFLQQAVLQQHPNGVDIKASHSLPSAAQSYNNWSHFLEDRNAAQHPEYAVPSVGSAVQYPRPEDGIYFSGQPHSWSYNANSNQSISSATLGGGISTDVRCVQPESSWPQVNSSSYPNSSFPVEAERSVL